MDNQWVFDVMFGVAGFLGAFVLNNLARTVSKVEDKVNELPMVYVVKQDYQNDIAEIKEMLREIYGDLRKKADRHEKA